jgi:hypothetical protein
LTPSKEPLVEASTRDCFNTPSDFDTLQQAINYEVETPQPFSNKEQEE